jgi:3-hydroxyisobutyrate dehydrogenase-like beta-hydroxyacid dehydrogenase
MPKQVGFIGVGSMGSAIASRLVGGHDLYVNDLNPAVAEELVASGATFVSAQEIAEQCSVIFLCLPAPKHVTDLLFGSGNLADSVKPGSVIIDITSSTPLVDADITARLSERGVRFVDSPIAGGVRRARSGEATLMVGADDSVFSEVEGLLKEITPNVFHVGPVGAGHAMKLANNLMNSCHRFVALQVLQLATNAGIDEKLAIEVINKGSGRSYVTEYTYPELMYKNQMQGFTIELMRKDVRLATELAAGQGIKMEIADLVERYMDEAVAALGPSADQTEMMLKWQPSAQ